MEQPPSYVQNGFILVCHPNKFLCCIKKTPRAWYVRMDIFILDIVFSIWNSHPNVYTKKLGIHLIILVLHVDDLILTGSDPKILAPVKSNLKRKFEMTYLGYFHYFLGLQVFQTKEGIFIS
jgi:hypothetical protein